MNNVENHLKEFFSENKEKINNKIQQELQADFQNLMEWHKEFFEKKYNGVENPINFEINDFLIKILNHFYTLKELFLGEHYKMMMGAIKKEKN